MLQALAVIQHPTTSIASAYRSAYILLGVRTCVWSVVPTPGRCMYALGSYMCRPTITRIALRSHAHMQWCILRLQLYLLFYV